LAATKSTTSNSYFKGITTFTASISPTSPTTTGYNFNNIIVSDSHIVKYNNKWIPVCNHPDATIITSYDKPYLYCLNTSNKIISIKNYLFTDWDEIYDNDIYQIINNNILPIRSIKEIHQLLDSGFNKDTEIKLKNNQIKKIKDIIVGDILEEGENVYGIVKINGKSTIQYEYDLGKINKIIGGPNLNICDSKLGFTSTLSLDKKYKFKKINTDEILYHLLTDKKTFTLENTKFYDYNATIDLFLDKYRGKLLSMKYV
jgi:hypothetical protein